MVGSNKILTVSYGTFSCTLEGFDDSFGTMKVIAEYFRDLAADDRYFGAEPPVPDAQMLARIAEREVARRVEARLDGMGVTLRTGTALPQVAESAPAGESAPVVEPAQIDGPAPQVDTVTAVLTNVQTFVAPAAAFVAPAPVVTPARPVMRQTITRAEPETPPMAVTPLMPPAMVGPDLTGANPTGPAVLPPRRVAPTAALRIEQPAVSSNPVEPPKFAIPAHPDADSVAAKLQRIRAVVGKAAVPFAAQDYAEDLGEPVAPAQTQNALGGPLLSLSANWDDLDDLAFDSAAFTAVDIETARPATLGLSDLDHPDAAPVIEPAAEVLTQEPESLTEIAPEPAAAPVRARVIRVRRADAEASAGAAEIVQPVETTADIQMPSDTDLAELVDLDALGDLRALDGIADEAEADEMAFDQQPAAPLPQMELGDGTLAPDAEAALIEELAALERDATQNDAPVLDATAAPDSAPFSLTSVMAAAAADSAKSSASAAIDRDAMAALFDVPPGDDDTFDFTALADAVAAETDTDTDTDNAPAPRTGRDLLEREPEADAEALERILSQTDAELNAPENSRRRDAIAQLKAAVAATEAARLLGETAPEPDIDDVENAFRDDLKQVVRPRRPMGEVSPDLRSERPRPAPLKLVASQRIDIPPPRPAPKPMLPVRPRRVSVQDDQDQQAAAAPLQYAGSFAEFAASMGATQLPDLLEAAAAYTSFVEGVEDFSRPQLMKKVQDMAVEDFSREDGLRSFGTLLRQGRIMKTANGRFVVSEESRFNPERKSA